MAYIRRRGWARPQERAAIVDYAAGRKRGLCALRHTTSRQRISAQQQGEVGPLAGAATGCWADLGEKIACA